MTSAAHLTNALCSASVTPQQGKCPVVGVGNLFELRRMTSRARNGSGFNYGQMRRSTFGYAVPKYGISNPVYLAAREIGNSSGQVFETLLRRPLMAHPITAQKPSIVTFEGQPVVTTAQLAEYYGVSATNIRKNYSVNADRFIEGKHCQTLTNGKLAEFKNRVTESNSVKIARNVNALTLWTRRGAARHAKMLNSDKAWEVFEQLEDSYFAPQAPADELPFTMAELTTQARELLAMSSDLEAGAGRLRHKVSSLFSKAQHNGFYAPRALPAPKGKTNVRAHLRKLPRKGAV